MARGTRKGCAGRKPAPAKSALPVPITFHSSRPLPPDDQVYFESESDEEFLPPQPAPINDEQPHVKIEEPDSPLEPEEAEYSPEQSFAPARSRRARIVESVRILKADEFKAVGELNFRIFGEMLQRTRVYAMVLISGEGRMLYADKLGHQLFQGSLNNFDLMHVQDLMLGTQREVFLSRMSAITEYTHKTVLHWLIYSKNSKRRYNKVPFDKKVADEDTFFRFLKPLCVRIRPVRVCFEQHKQIEGYWNKLLVKDGVSMDCFLVEARLSSSFPNLSMCALESDQQLQHFIATNRLKAAAWANRSSLKKEEGVENQSPPHPITPQRKHANKAPTLHAVVKREEMEVCKVEGVDGEDLFDISQHEYESFV